ncbi:hypothetical protein ACFQBQ_16595 [Granulicella cerasi]|uniref:TonB-dependent receptor n=1 Tax=Granulicella cerasi TaxID=741063 RepID=A0ABW1ZCE0_9BACT
MTYSKDTSSSGFSVTVRAYHGQWHSSDQIAESALSLVGIYGTLNPTDGGHSQRYSLQGEWHRQGEHSRTKITAYGFYHDPDLFSEFTYYLTDLTRGDQFEQQDRRWAAGIDAPTINNDWLDIKSPTRSACRCGTIGFTTDSTNPRAGSA